MSVSMRISLLTFVLTVSLVGSVSAEFPVGDLNGDCDVNSLDLKIFVEQWLDPSGCSGHPDDCADFDGVNGINSADFALLAGNWLIQTGSLQVTILPPEAAAAGAQWQVDGGAWRNSGYTETCVTAGTHTVEYKPIADWNEPNSQTVQINDGQTTTTTGTYVLQTGSLQVTILPSEAVTTGAQWRVDGGAWRDSEYIESGLAVGSHTVEYNTITGWDTPANETVQINDGLTTTTTGTYVQQTGSLQVTILPPEAIAAGAKWRVDNRTWRDSGFIETDLSAGPHTVRYKDITGWDIPADETVQINGGLTTTTTGTYVQQTGSLQVTISPPGAVTAGAQWRVDGGTWRDSDYVEAGLAVGSHTVEYSTAAGWDTPTNETVQINDGQTTTTSGTYIQQTGSLQVTISPPGAVTAGAQWRVDGGAWRDSDYTESGLSVGSHTVEYSTVSGWNKPADEIVQINDGQTTTTSNTYTQQTGYLQVTISPPGAVTAGAKWRVDGGAWRDSDYIESGLAVGSHTVEYNTITGWDTPVNETVQINDGQTTTTSGTYDLQTGSLQVTISPPGAVTAGAQWRVDGGAWRDSDYTESGLSVGSHTVEYSTVSGWNKPADEIVQINDGQTTTATGTYALQTGSLQVTISPLGAVTAGAQWRVDGGAWRDSNDIESGLAVGSHTVEYKTIAGWDTPINETVQINDGQTTTTTGTYVQQTGSLQVTISPPGAVTAGAQWRVDGGAWRDSDYTESGLSVGSHTVEYSTVSGWNKPADEIVQINDGQTTTTTGTYTQQTGYLQVTISPPGAIDAGAQWKVDGGAWRDSDYIEGGLTVGSHTVEYSTVSGWNKPADEIVQINDGQTTTTTGTYTQQTGYLQVTISPPGAVTAGAQWRVDGGAWRDSDYIEVGLTVGSHTVEYNTVTGWDTPVNETVQINDGQTTTTTGTYTQQTGSLQVTISPPGAVTAGAQWRVDGGTWHDSGYTESGLTVGSHTVEYNTITGWDTPVNETVQINDGQTTTTTGTYTQQTGYLQVTISPPGAVTAGAQWRVDGGAWRDSDYTESGLTVGSHTVEYSTVSDWNKPTDEIVQINDGQTTTTTGTYTQQTGLLQVTISPPGAIDAGAQWRVDGGAWRDSDYTESGLTVGSHTVEYSTVSGWNKPADETVQINDGQTTTTTGTYTQQTGYLQVTISPPGAVTAGAQWRVDGGTWRDSEYTEAGLVVGSYTVEYKAITDWNEPANETVQINNGQTTTTMGIYIAQTGSLQVTISPQAAIDAGAQWRVLGGTWRNSGYTDSGLPIGWYTVEYSTVSGWNKPVDETVQIHNSQLTTVSGNYIEQAGASLIISEFMASNTSTPPLEQGELLDGNGDSSDWIEIYNPTDATVSLDGWYLTDDDADLTKWQFPDGNQLDPGEFMIIFASQKTYVENPLNYPYLDLAGYYHTNFELDKDGDYLALVAPDGNTVIHEYTPEYPDQLTNISYGLAQYSTTLVPTGATATYHVPTISDAGLGTDWTDPNFDDSSWDTGETGLGFASGALESGQDIGNPTAAGSYSVSNGVYTVLGDGNDIWSTGDSFYYVYTPLHGDGELIARVVSVEQTDNWAKAGLMFRETLDAGSKFSNVLITGANGCRMQERNSTGGSAVSDSSVATAEQIAITAPYWVRLKREGLTTFRGYYSADGAVWTEMVWSPRTIDMAEDCYVGLCVTSHSNGVLCTAVYDNITFGSEVGSDLKASMLGINASLWTRIEFEVEDCNTLDSLKLRMKYEDGFVAYLNGEYIAEQNAPASLQWNSTATSDRPIEDSSVFEEFNLMSFIHLLLPKPQKNVLAIHGLNDDPANEEFLILPELVAASNLSVPQYFASPTPGTFNITGAEGIVSDVWFSHKRGFYDTSFGLMLSTEMGDGEIRYTIDGSRPTITYGFTFNYNTDPPIDIDTTTTIRAVAVKPGWLDSPVETHTYLFLDDVIQQPIYPPGFPTSGWGYAGPDYEMDPEVVLSYSSTIKNDMKAVPTLSLAMDVNDWFGSGGQGIYIQGELSERAVSAELILPDGNDGFQIDCAVMIVGGSSVNRWKMDKLSMRLKFLSAYGPTKLRFPVFGDKATDEFDTLVVDARMNNSWAYGGSVGINRPGLGQRDVAQYTRDQFVSDIQNDMGGYGGQGRHVHLYLNGLYWGLYWLHERPDEHFAASYFGGNDEDYDVLKHNSGIVVNGSGTNYNEMFTVANAGLESDSQFQLIQEYLDVPGLIDYLLTNFYVGNTDWDHHNWYASRSRVNPASRWLYHSWDAEHVMEGLNDDVTGKNNSGAPTRLHQQLAQNAEYKLLFADHLHRHFYNDGVLTPEGATALYNIRLNDVDRAVVGESARWGDNHRTTPYTRDIEWITERDWLLNTYFQERTDIVFEDLKGRDLYPEVNAPTFSQYGGWDPTGFNVSMSSSSGTIHYATDGNDPRVPIAESSPGSIVTLVAENAARNYLVPTGPLAGSTGSILREYWTGISGTAVSNLTSSPDYPGNPSGIDYLATFEAPTGWADDYGTRVRGYLHPPANGSYTFWISSDDASELWLSTDDDPINKVLIAFETNWSSVRTWQLGGDEESAPIALVGGQKYYIEALHKEGGGGDNLAVAWSLDNNPPSNGDPPIDGQYLSPAGDTWATTYFDDSNWPSGTGGVGYEKNPGDPVNFVGLFNINVEGDMYGNNGTCYIRIPFTVSNTDLSSMTLKIKYDDGFIAYLNGAEVARRNFSGTPQWDSAATSENPDTSAINFENIDISSHTGVLQPGNNVLAIQGLNISTADSDFLISAELVVTEISQGDVSPSATPYTGAVPLARTTNLKARVLDGSTWSALNEAIFAVGHVADYLRVTEIMYHPHDTGDPNDPNTEFIELKNIGPSTLYLNLVRFTEGIHFTFPDVELASGGHIVVVKDITAFDNLYDIQTNNINVAGQYFGSLANNGEGVRLQDAIGRTILDFDYEDGWRSITDGDGFSLTIIDPTNSDPNSWSEKDSWRASVYRYGSPGWDDSGILPDPGAVVINEVMAHSNAGPDWIELHNTTSSPIDIGGWFLSDNNRDEPNLMKYRIDDGTTIALNGYIVFYEDTDFNNPGDPCCLIPFALSENGDEACLSSAPDQYGRLTGYRQVEGFGASQTNVSLGRYFKPSTGNFNFVAMDSNTPLLPNDDPRVGPVVINEIMYNPPSGNQNEEYIELHNITGALVTLYRYDKSTPWKFTDGIDYTFSSGPVVTIQAYGYVMVVKDMTAFTARYGGMPPGVQVLIGYSGMLSNAGERLQIGMPGDTDELGTRQYIRIDRVTYSDGFHPDDCPGGVDLWPAAADGLGKSLSRKVSADYGNDVANWQAATPSPGVVNP